MVLPVLQHKAVPSVLQHASTDKGDLCAIAALCRQSDMQASGNTSTLCDCAAGPMQSTGYTLLLCLEGHTR